MCTCISTWNYVYLTPHVWSTPYDSYMESWVPLCVSLHVCPSHLIFVPTPCLEYVQASVHEFMSTWLLISGPPPLHSWWKPGCPCMALCLCPSHLISVDTPCLECVHASVHESMSTLHPSSGPPPMDSYMGKLGAPVCQCMCVPVTLFLFLHLILNGYMHQYMNLFPAGCLCLVHPLCIVWWEIWVPLCVTLSMSHSPWLWSHTLFRMCTCIST